MTIKYLATAALTGMIAIGSAAQDKIVLLKTDKTNTVMNLAEISRITFDGDKMVIANNGQDQVFTLDQLENMRFDDKTITGIDNITADACNLSVNNGVITATALNSEVIISVYNTAGLTVTTTRGDGTASIDLKSLPKGLYIVKANDKAIKIIR